MEELESIQWLIVIWCIAQLLCMSREQKAIVLS